MPMPKSRRAKACDIPKKVKDAVWERDHHQCIRCGSPYAFPNAHYIRRSSGGLGIEENIVTLCMGCHNDFDNGWGDTPIIIGAEIKRYLQDIYPSWDESNLYYQKWR